jgi:hypothetical protein
MNLSSFFAELKRRNVYKVAVAYAVVGWLLVQVTTQVFPFFEIPNWAVRLVVLAIAIGFPIALVIAWAFELTPEGLKRTEDVDLAAAAQRPRHRAWIFVVIIAGAMSLGLFFLGRITAPGKQSGANEVSSKSIAVLPFVNMSSDKEQEYFSVAEALAAAERETSEFARLVVCAVALWNLDRKSEADTALGTLISDDADVGAFQIAEVYSSRGDKDKAFSWLERARRQQDGGLAYYPNDPLLDPIRSDPRWMAFQRSMGLADDQLK